MRTKIIRKNIIDNNWEHLVSNNDGNIDHWSPSIISNDNLDFSTQIQSISRDADNNILVYKEVNYNKVIYDIVALDFTLANKTISELTPKTVITIIPTDTTTINPAEL